MNDMLVLITTAEALIIYIHTGVQS